VKIQVSGKDAEIRKIEIADRKIAIGKKDLWNRPEVLGI